MWFTKDEFANCLGIKLKGFPDSWLGGITYTDGGGVDTMVIAGKAFSGTEIRQKLGLRSTAFSMYGTVKSLKNLQAVMDHTPILILSKTADSFIRWLKNIQILQPLQVQ